MPYKLFVRQFCSCGISAYVPVSQANISDEQIEKVLRLAGWIKTDDWHCNKCRERSAYKRDPQENI